MRIRVVGYVDEVISFDADEEETYKSAEAAGRLSEFMEAYLTSLSIELTFGREEEFDGNPLQVR